MHPRIHSLKNRVKRQKIVRSILGHPFNGKIYLVGGAIRELYLGGKPNDYDMVLSEKSDLKALETLFNAGAFILGKKPINTFRIIKEGLSIDITFLEAGIQEDLIRRDFTMNAIAYDITGEDITDPLSGIDDIEKRLIRCPAAAETLKNDPLRMLKAARHFSSMKGFVLHEELIKNIEQCRHLIRQVAPERIKYEMDQIVVSKNVFAGLKLLESTGLLFEIFPELSSLRQMDIEKNFTLETYGHTIEGFKYLRKYKAPYNADEKALRDVGYALLFHDLGKASTFSYDDEKKLVHFFYHERVSVELALCIMERLRFSVHEIKAILKLIENHMRIFLISNSESTEKAAKRLVHKVGDLTPSLILLTLCDMYGSSGGKNNPSTKRIKTKCNEISNAYEEWKKKPLPKLVNGHDLIDLGFTEGPCIGKVLTEIQERQISGDISIKDEALNYAREFLESGI